MANPRDYSTIQLPRKVHARLKEVAEQEHRSMAKQIETWLEQHVLKSLEQKEAS